MNIRNLFGTTSDIIHCYSLAWCQSICWTSTHYHRVTV